MGLVFENELHDEFGTWPLAYIPFGGPDFGEIQAVGRAVGAGDDTAFYDAWVAAGAWVAADAALSASRGHRSSARDLFLRASAFYTASYHLLYGAPVDPRLVAAFRKDGGVRRRAEAVRSACAFDADPVRGRFDAGVLHPGDRARG